MRFSNSLLLLIDTYPQTLDSSHGKVSILFSRFFFAEIIANFDSLSGGIIYTQKSRKWCLIFLRELGSKVQGWSFEWNNVFHVLQMFINIFFTFDSLELFPEYNTWKVFTFGAMIHGKWVLSGYHTPGKWLNIRDISAKSKIENAKIFCRVNESKT